MKTASEYREHEKKRKDCEFCQDIFRLELLIVINMVLMFEKYIRDVITQAAKQYAKADNKYTKDQHNPNEKSRYLQYLDTNNLYG